MLGDRIGKLPYQPRQLLDLAGKRLAVWPAAPRLPSGQARKVADLLFQRRQPPAEFGQLARQVARPARQACDLIVHAARSRLRPETAL